METVNHEYYVSFDVAKLLKEAGFDWEVQSYYSKLSRMHGRLLWLTCGCKYKENININQNHYSAPTLDVAQRWLREVKKISVEVNTRRFVNRYHDGKYTVSYTHELWPINTLYIVPNDKNKFIRYTIDCACNIEFQTYEEALETGIKKSLEILLEKGE